MSTTGPKPKPTAKKKLQGNPGKRPLNRREPKPETAVKRPWGLGRGLRRQFWDDHAEELERLHLLTGIDVPAFRIMAEAYAFAIEAAKELQYEGFTVMGRDGPKGNPTARVWRDNAMLFKSMAAEFGLTPSARTRLKLPDEAEQLDFVDALFESVREAMEAEQDD